MRLLSVIVLLLAAAPALGDSNGVVLESPSSRGVKALRGGGAKLPDAARTVHRWRPAVCQRAKLGKACPLGITTFADGHAAVELLGIKLPQALGNAVARAVGRALPKGVADDLAPADVTLPKNPEECAARDAQVNKENGGHCSWITLSGGYCNCFFGFNNLPNNLPNNPPSRPVLGSSGIIINLN